jgi:hypothetical protein
MRTHQAPSCDDPREFPVPGHARYSSPPRALDWSCRLRRQVRGEVQPTRGPEPSGRLRAEYEAGGRRSQDGSSDWIERIRAQSAFSSTRDTSGLSIIGAKANADRTNVFNPSGPETTVADRGEPSIMDISPK